MAEEKMTAWQRFVGLLKLDKKDFLQILYYAIFAGLVNLSVPLGIQAIVNLIQGARITTSWIILVILVTLGVAFVGVLQLMQIRILENIQQKIFTRASFEFTYRFPKIKMSELENFYPPELANRFLDVITIQKGIAKLVLDFPAAILQIVAAEYLGIPVEQVKVELGDSNFPVTPGSGGSWGAASYCNGARAACENAVMKLKDNRSIPEDQEVALAELLKQNQLTKFEMTGMAEPSTEFEKHSVFSFGANFAEVWVDKDTGMWRIERMVNVGAAGKILNPKTAYGQIIGGLTMGAGMAIAEKTDVEPNFGNFITRSFADYHVPVNLDMANIDVIFLPEEDKIANKMGIKGIGELGITSVAASLSNAIFNATGKRMRELPITPEKLIEAPLEPGVQEV